MRFGRKTAAVVFAVLLCIAAFAVLFIRGARREEAGDSSAAIREAVRSMAMQCYVIEGAYPMSLAYLEENYGLAVNQEDYLIIYTPFAENQPPDIRVIDRRTQGERNAD